jgi:hypothetical protein
MEKEIALFPDGAFAQAKKAGNLESALADVQVPQKKNTSVVVSPQESPLTHELLQKRNVADLHGIDKDYHDPHMNESYLLLYNNANQKGEHLKVTKNSSSAFKKGWQ